MKLLKQVSLGFFLCLNIGSGVMAEGATNSFPAQVTELRKRLTDALEQSRTLDQIYTETVKRNIINTSTELSLLMINDIQGYLQDVIDAYASGGLDVTAAQNATDFAIKTFRDLPPEQRIQSLMQVDAIFEGGVNKWEELQLKDSEGNLLAPALKTNWGNYMASGIPTKIPHGELTSKIKDRQESYKKKYRILAQLQTNVNAQTFLNDMQRTLTRSLAMLGSMEALAQTSDIDTATINLLMTTESLVREVENLGTRIRASYITGASSIATRDLMNTITNAVNPSTNAPARSFYKTED